MPTPAVLAGAAFPAPILEVLRRLDEAGHRSWLVGGAVRDLLLHRARETADFDVATPAKPEQVTALFRKVIPTGIAHGTVTVRAMASASLFSISSTCRLARATWCSSGSVRSGASRRREASS